MAKGTKPATAVIMASVIATVLVALATALPWYRAENPDTGVGTYYYLDYADSDVNGLYDYTYFEPEGLEYLLWVEKVFVYIWIALALFFVVSCLMNDRWGSLLSGFCTAGASVFVTVYFAARIERVADWSGNTSAALGYMVVLVAFVVQFLAILGETWTNLTLAVDDMKGKSGETKT